MTMGLLFVVFRARLDGLLRVPAALTAGVGVVAAGWSAVMLGQTVRMEWRTGIKQTLSCFSLVELPPGGE